MVQKKLERVIEECCAAVPLLTKLAFTVVAFICAVIGYSCLIVSGRISDKEDDV